MPFVNEPAKSKHYTKKYFGICVTRERVMWGPDPVTLVTIPWFQRRKPIWRRAK